jgi:hypothetical protein
LKGKTLRRSLRLECGKLRIRDFNAYGHRSLFSLTRKLYANQAPVHAESAGLWPVAPATGFDVGSLFRAARPSSGLRNGGRKEI